MTAPRDAPRCGACPELLGLQGGFRIDVVARAAVDRGGHDADRSFVGLIGGALVVRDNHSGDLATIPLEGGAPTVVARNVGTQQRRWSDP
jgi:hypothetical protein